MGNVFLIGKDSDMWMEDESDLVALKQWKTDDPSFAWISDNIIQPFHLLIGRHFRVINPSPLQRYPLIDAMS